MAKTCIGNVRTDITYIRELSDDHLLEGLASHSDPKWWGKSPASRMNQAYLRRWGAYLRREARRRGLL